MNTETIDASITRGLDFLHRRQLPSGEFQVVRSTDPTLQHDCVADSSLFPTALIVYCLGFADSATASAMVERSLGFLLSEMERSGVWRYWTKTHPYHAMIPPDLDDTACVSYVLRQHGIPFPSNRALVLANRDRRGLFHTWLTPRWPPPRSLDLWRVTMAQWANPAQLFRRYTFFRVNESAPNDVDGVVNANTLLYLGDGPAMRAVTDYLIDIVRGEREGSCDKWHLNRFTFYYAVARAFHAGISALGAIQDEVVRRILASATPDGAIGDSELETALAACALLSWSSAPPELERAICFLMDKQRAAGAWRASVMYYGGPRRYYGWGSEELTTGFCLEALLRYRTAIAARP